MPCTWRWAHRRRVTLVSDDQTLVSTALAKGVKAALVRHYDDA
jgi:hypothetical protein